MPLPQFDYYGLTQVNAEEFKELKKAAHAFSNEADECIKEIAAWIGDDKSGDVVFTICGM